MWGIAKVGIHTPPMAAKSTVRVAPKGADCSWVFAKVPKSTPKPIAESPDCTGVDGGLDQPGEPIIWDGKIIVSCFDLVTGPDKVNTKHEMPATLVQLDL